MQIIIIFQKLNNRKACVIQLTSLHDNLSIAEILVCFVDLFAKNQWTKTIDLVCFEFSPLDHKQCNLSPWCVDYMSKVHEGRKPKQEFVP